MKNFRISDTIAGVKYYADIAFRQHAPSTNDGLFTFAIPESLQERIFPGCIVSAPFRKTLEHGIVVTVHAGAPSFATETIVAVRTPPLLDENQFRLAAKVAKKNFAPLARVLPLFLPGKLFTGNGNPPQITIVSLDVAEPLPKLGKKMLEVVEFLRVKGATEIHTLRSATGATTQTLARLLELAVVTCTHQARFIPQQYGAKKIRWALSPEQETALTDIKQSFHTLLFAPTGSGKSHILRKLAEEMLLQGKTVFFLVPEIGLTDELVQKCEEVFGQDLVCCFHSRLSEGEREEAYWRVRFRHAGIIVGSRSALFLPFAALGLIVMEEEHEWTFKSDQSPRYHARDVAEELAALHGARLVYATATPSMEIWQRARTQDISIARLPGRAATPTVTIIDMKDEVAAKNRLPISRVLINKVQKALTAGQQALLFLNRRGLFRAIICQDCGEITRCPECSIALVTHPGKEQKNYLLCHLCGRVYGVAERCGHCRGTNMQFVGSGTARIEAVARQLFPDKRIVRIDRDTTTKKSGFKDLHATFNSGLADILVGTQIVAKGLDFANIGVVGVLDADAGLNIPDFRASERTFQLLVQVAGRAGRRGQPAELVLQTRLPELPLFRSLTPGSEENFYNQELALREKYFLPPISRIAKVIFSSVKKETAYTAARKLEGIITAKAAELYPNEHVDVSVAPALNPKKHGKYFVNLLVICKHPEELLHAVPLPHCRIDIDPVDVVS